ncbi:MAG: hypothetical protein H7X86_02045 [Gorillibacterium sp.]|nr:hypothetical protein [Gorillibacterium sp.]
MAKAKKAAKSFTVWLLIVLQAFLGIGGVVGGLLLVVDPSGDLIMMPIDLLEHSPFPNFLIPGLILLVVLGIIPTLISYALARKPNWSFGDKLNIFKELHWTWAFSLYIGFALIIWITVEVYMLQEVSIVHLFYIALGLIIQAVTVLPSVRNHYLK